MLFNRKKTPPIRSLIGEGTVLRGDLASSLRLHAFGPPLVLLAAGVLWHQLVLGRALDRRALAVWMVAGSFLGWLYWLLRLAHPELLP